MSFSESLALIVAAIVLNGVTAVGAYLKRAVSPSGAVAGLLVGAGIFYLGGVVFWVHLMLFFGSSTVASRIGTPQKERLERMHEKGSRRDAVQVVANAGVPLVGLFLAHVTGVWWYLLLAAGAFASANADTWASEIGVLSRRRPRSIITREPLEPGTSGGTSPLGTVASLVGSALIAVWTAITLLLIRDSGTTDLVTGNLSGIDTARPMGVLGVLLLVWFAGAAGSVIDSVLGATVQAQYRTRDGDYTERRSLLPANDASDANDRQVNAKVRGVHWVTNDVVNLVSALGAASLAVKIGIVLS
jgi:uncharacterized protein (TIGR00297 family)